MNTIKNTTALLPVIVLLFFTPHVCWATDPINPLELGNPEAAIGIQVMKELPIRVVNSDNQPVSGAVVTPWALRSSQGHGLWSDSEDDRAEVQPKPTTTDENGLAIVHYPYLRDVEEGIRTLSVSLFVDHRKYAFSSSVHIDLPLEEATHEIMLDDGFPVELRPTINGESVDTKNLFAFWSDGRSWRSSDTMRRTSESTLRLPPCKAGMNSVIVAKMEGDHVTHFSKIIDFEILTEGNSGMDVPLSPVVPMEGTLSAEVPRPVRNGRIKLETLSPSGASNGRVEWCSWVPIQPNGTFVIEAWPVGEKIQLIALCDGFIAKSGTAPVECENPRDPDKDPFDRPQVFDPNDRKSIMVEMTPTVKCIANVVDENDQPLAGVTIAACPKTAIRSVHLCRRNVCRHGRS